MLCNTYAQVAHYLLETGLPTMEGVVFIDGQDRRMILLRKGWKVRKLQQCGIPLSKRFSFYDQVRCDRPKSLPLSLCVCS